jgi:hypothetical protein
MITLPRRALTLLIPAAACMLAACGSSESTPTAQASASPNPNVAGDYVLNTSALPAGTETWQQASDGTLNGNASTDQRSWQNADNTQRIEIDVFLDSSATTAQSDYAQWESAIKQKSPTVTSTPACPPAEAGAVSCAEVIGETSDTKSQALMTWQQERVLVAVFLVDANTTVDQPYFESVCAAEYQLVAGLAGA